MRDVEIDRRLRGRSEMEAELRDAEARRRSAARRARADRPRRGRGPAVARGGARRPDRPADRPSSRASSARSRPRRCRRPRDAAALEIDQKTSALEALGPIAKEPRARERLEVEVRDQEGALERARDDEANARARVEANTVDAEQVAGQAERLAAWREQLAAAPASPARLRRRRSPRSTAPSRRR